MSAIDQIRNDLDLLMGTNRNGNSTSKVKFYSNKVCKNFLLDCCPYEAFQNTRLNMGPCRKIHDVALRADFENDADKDKYYFDVEAFDILKEFMDEFDYEIRKATRRLIESHQDQISQERQKLKCSIDSINSKIREFHKLAEKLGKNGQVEDSMAVIREVDSLRLRRMKLEIEYNDFNLCVATIEPHLKICKVCSAHVVSKDCDVRVNEHIDGKLHKNLLKLRGRLLEFEKTTTSRMIKLRNQKRYKRPVFFVKVPRIDRNFDNYYACNIKVSRDRSPIAEYFNVRH